MISGPGCQTHRVAADLESTPDRPKGIRQAPADTYRHWTSPLAPAKAVKCDLSRSTISDITTCTMVVMS
jgi:hypothetical protein